MGSTTLSWRLPPRARRPCRCRREARPSRLRIHSINYSPIDDATDAFEAKYPTGPEVVQPPMGYAYGVQVAALPMAVPVLPTAVPFTAVPGVATFDPLPMGAVQ